MEKRALRLAEAGTLIFRGAANQQQGARHDQEDHGARLLNAVISHCTVILKVEEVLATAAMSM
jgi:hypothetical protein